MQRNFNPIQGLLAIFAVVSFFAIPFEANFAQENQASINLRSRGDLDLPALVQWLADVKGMEIITNSKTFPDATNKVIIFGDVEVTPESLLEMVQSILQANGFALVKSDLQDLYQIVELAKVRPFAPLIGEANVESAEYVTGIFPLENVTTQEAETFIKQMMYGASAQNTVPNITILPGRNTLIISETSKRMKRIQALLKEVDIPGNLVFRKFYKPKHLQAVELKQQLDEILELSSTTTGAATTPNGKNRLRVVALVRSNQVLINGSQAQLEEAQKLIDQLDIPEELELRSYQFEFVSAQRVDDLIRQSFARIPEEQLSRLYQASINSQTNELVVTSREEVHRRIESLKQQLDVKASTNSGQSPMRFYTLKNVKAIEMLDTLQAIERRVRAPNQNERISNRLNGITDATNGRGITLTGPTNFQQGFSPNGPTLFDPLGRQQSGPVDQGISADSTFGNSVVGDIARLASGFGAARKLIPGEATLTVDENTNTLIVVAEPPIQRLYADLIEKLDVRRPQVLIQVQVVTITGQEDFNLGIEISAGDRTGSRRTFSFTSFGLSEIDAATGALSILPGLGFNGTLVDPDTADVVLSALARHRRARVVTAPRILVNDNATGLLSSVAEVPFQSAAIGNTISTTNFGGFAQAGTTISVTPQISDDDYLNLDFDILVNNFSGAATGTLPPPRNTDQVTSQVSIPDGHTVIVGGLTRKQFGEDLQGLPIIEHIPILNRLTSNQIETSERQRLFVFIKPVILRDDKFRDLRFISDSERNQACIPDDFPKSGPTIIR